MHAQRSATTMPSEKDPLVPVDGGGGSNNREGAAAAGAEQGQQLMIQMEERRRQRLILSLAAATLACAMMGALLVWRLHEAGRRRQEALPNLVAGQALDLLNRHVSKQSRHVQRRCESTLLLMRHCEKEGPRTTDARDGTEHCSYIGYERAAHLASLFGEGRKARWPAPAHLFALTPERAGGGGHLNFREWETLKPLSDRSGVVSELHGRWSLPQQYFELLRSGDLCGRVAVVSWKHEFIPELARNLGCGPRNGCPAGFSEDDFDSVWQLKYVFHPAQPPPPDEDELKENANFTAFDEPLEDDDVDTSNGDNNDGGAVRRLLRHGRNLKHHEKPFSNHGWNVYATVSHQDFDPLAYSKQLGDYPPDGAPKGGSWNDGGL